MHKWTDEEVTRLTKVLVAGLCSSDADQDRSKCVRLFAAIADEIGADAWTFRTGMYLHDLQLPRVEWTDSQTSEIFDYDSNKMTLKMTLGADELAADLAHRMQTEEGEPWKPICSATQVFVFDSPTQWQTLVWVGMAANGQVGNLEFHRAPSAGPFSDFHRALVKMAAAQLMASLETIQPYTNCVDVLEQLPRRQREVLEKLQCGLSTKGIAAELGISCYTVNDYLKSLYRRFGVCSRVELLAAINGQLRTQVAAAVR